MDVFLQVICFLMMGVSLVHGLQLKPPLVDLWSYGSDDSLSVAIIGRLLNVFQKMSGVKANLEYVNEEDNTFLFLAAREGNLSMTALLLKYGAPVNQTDKLGRTALFGSVLGGNIKVFSMLLDYGAKVEQVSNNGETAFQLSLRLNKLDIAKILIGRGANVNSFVNQAKSKKLGIHDRTALMRSSCRGHFDAVKMLLEYGANANQVCHGKTALFGSVLGGNLDVVEILLKQGANVNQLCNDLYDGDTALWRSVRNKKMEVVQLLLEYGANVENCQLQHPTVRFNPPMVDLLEQCTSSARLVAFGGFVQVRLAIEAGTLRAPLMQWVPLLPTVVRAELSAWVTSSTSDSSACYAAFFRPLKSPHPATCALRDQIGHSGISHIRGLVISFLVFHNPTTRKIICECNAFGSHTIVTPIQVAEAVSRVDKVRAAWAKQEGSSSVV